MQSKDAAKVYGEGRGMINCSECGKFISHDWSNLSHMCSDCGYDWKATAEVESDPELSAILLAEGNPSEYVSQEPLLEDKE